MILDIRGTHGSGKSWVVHKLLQEELDANGRAGVQYICEGEPGGRRSVGTYCPGYDLAILGDYDRVCGGCDGIRTAEEVCRRVRVFASEYKNVLLEGILVAHTFRRYADLARDLLLSEQKYKYAFCFMNTPYDECVRRVQERRVARGQPAEFDLFHITNDYRRCHERLPIKFREAGYRVEILDWQDPMPQVRELLCEA